MKGPVPYWIERRAVAMGSTAHIQVGDADPRLADWAVDEVERLERCWSRFLPDSELSRLNASHGTWVRVSAPMVAALRCADDLWTATQGAFDPTVLAALERTGYDVSFEQLDRLRVALEFLPEHEPAPGWGSVELDLAGSKVRIPAGTRLDLGGLGKGLAADRVAEGLVHRGARSALVSLGGDIRAAGEAPDGGWQIPVEDPLQEGRVLHHHTLEDGAIVTSTRLIRSWSRGGREFHHIIDPRTGYPADTDVVAVVATGGTAALAEGLAKATMILGVEQARPLLDAAGVHALAFDADRSVAELGGLPA